MLDFWPEPDACVAISGDWFGECIVSSAPFVDDLWSCDANASRNFYCVHKIVDIDLPSHGMNTTRGCTQDTA